jgi:hypothetical protein
MKLIDKFELWILNTGWSELLQILVGVIIPAALISYGIMYLIWFVWEYWLSNLPLI